MPWTKNQGVEFDAYDAELLARRIAARARLPGPLVGDFVVFSDGVVHRLSYSWLDCEPPSIQTSEHGSFYLCWHGDADFSGGLNPAIPMSTITDTGETREGAFWFFHHDHAAPHYGVGVEVPCKVYRSTLPSDWWHLNRRDEFPEITF